jgi:outer membrane protein assembly factor BamB
VSLTGTSSAVVTADASGNYIFSGLANGNYTVTPSEAGFTFSPSSLPVTVNGANVAGINFTASQITPVLSVAPTGVFMPATQGGTNPAPAAIAASNSAGGPMSFTATSDSSWLTVNPGSGSAPQQLQLSASITGLALGTYKGHVTITANGAQGSPATVTVTLTIGVATDWLTVDHDSSRSGYAVDETTISSANVANLQLSWSTSVDGSVTAQPLFVHNIQIAGQTRDILIVGTGGNSLYTLDASNGSTLWTRNFGPPTPNTWGLPDGFGIEAPPFIDRVAGRIYTVSTEGNFRTLSLLDGTDLYPALPLIVNPSTNKVWGGLNRVDNAIYVATGSNGGDVSPWRGQVYQIDISGTPAVTGNFVVVPSIPAPNGGGGIWGYGGVSADLATGTIYGSSAFDSNVNSNGNEQAVPYADSMFALNSSLNLLGYYQAPTPTTIPCSGAPCDLDFASSPIFFEPTGCPSMVTAGNKNGNLYLFRAADLATSAPPLQVLTLNAPNDSLGSGGVGGVPAYSPANNMLYITDAGPGVTGVSAGIVALKVTSSCRLQVAWSQPLGGNDTPNSTPTIANGVVFVGQGNSGVIHAYDAQSGTELWHSGSQYGAAATFAAPIVAGGKVYAGSWSSFSGGGMVGGFSLNTVPVLSVSPSSLSFAGTMGGNNPQPQTINVTNSGFGTLNFTAASDRTAWLSVSPTTGTAPQALQASVSIGTLGNGTYVGHITITAPGATGSPAVVTVTLTVGSSSHPPAMDVTVFKDNSSAGTSITTSAFSTNAGNVLLLAFVATDYLSNANTTVTGVSGAGLTWVLVARRNAQSGTSEIWRAFAPSPLANVSVTATLSQSVMASMTVMTFTGVDTSGTNGSGAIGATSGNSASSGAPTASLVTTRNNSWVFGVGNDYDNAISRTPGAGQSLVHQDLTPVGDTYWVQMQNSPTPVSGTTVTINDTAPTTDRYNLCIVEVLPGS